jgi:ribosomal protein S12 methylthiotransferase
VIASLISLGCSRNRVDSELILGNLAQRGYEISAVPDGVDELIINTCSFIRPAVEEAFSEIERALELKRAGRVKRIWVVGCLVQRYGERLSAHFPEVDGFLGINYLKGVGLCPGGRTSNIPATPWSPKDPRLLTTRGYAYLRIADGCENNCSYCLLPQIRGRYRSRPIPELKREASRLVRMGAEELILVAQDTTLYGVDLYGSSRLPQLIRALARLPGVRLLRLLYTHPGHYTPELVATIRETEKLRYIDLPIQHISDSILERMSRGYDRARIESLLSNLRSIENLVLRTTFLVGFPGETELEFVELCRFIEEQRFDWLGCFPYYQEEGAPAYHYSDQLPEAVKLARRDEVLRVQAEIALEARKHLKGRILKVKIEGATANFCVGRSYRESPEVDGLVYIRNSKPALGELVKVKVEEVTPYDTYGVRV